MREYKLKLKNQKCAFDIFYGKFLGFIVSRREIDVDPKKVESIFEMYPPRILKELISIQCKIQAVIIFIAQ